MGFIKLIIFVVALLLVGGLGYSAYSSFLKNKRLRGSLFVVIALIVVAILSMISASFGQVPAGNRGVVLKFGGPTGQVLDEGFYSIMPFVNTVEMMSVQTEAQTSKVNAASKDLQSVSTELTLNYSLDPGKVVETFTNLRRDYEVRIIVPAIQEAVKAATAGFTAEELITSRPLVRVAIEANISERMDEFGIIIHAVSITDFTFSASFDAAIEAKVTAEQRALEAQRDLERVNFEAQQVVVRAQAEADAIRIQSEAIADGQGILQLRWIEKWDGRLPYMMTGDALPLVDMSSMMGTAPSE